jgi:hypothetical protein
MVLTAVGIKAKEFWDVMPFTSVGKRRYLREIHLHMRVRNPSKINEIKNNISLIQLFFSVTNT